MIFNFFHGMRIPHLYVYGMPQSLHKKANLRQKLMTRKIETFVEMKISFDLGKNGGSRSGR